MGTRNGSCPLSQRQQIEEYFMTARNQVLEIAAFLDRLDRASAADAHDDFRLLALREALVALNSDETDRIRRVQMIFSDQNLDLLEQLDQKGAFGAAKPRAK